VLKYPTIKRRVDKLSAGDMTIGLANHLQEYNVILNTPETYIYNYPGRVKLGFSDGVGSEDLITLYEGNLIDVSYKGVECSIKFQDTIERLKKQIIGTSQECIGLHYVGTYCLNPAEMFAAMINSHSTEAFGTIVNCAAWASWKNECGSRSYQLRGSSKGESILKLMDRIKELTNTIFSVEENKIYPSIMSITASAATYTEEQIFPLPKLEIETDRMVNKVELLFSPSYLSEVDSKSYSTYGGHEKYFDHTEGKSQMFLIWPDLGVAYRAGGIAFVSDFLGKYSRPLKHLEIEVGMMGYRHQMNDRVYVSLAVASLNNEAFRVEGIDIKPDKGRTKLDLFEDRIAKYSTSFNPFYSTMSDPLHELDSWHDMNPSGYINGVVRAAVIFAGNEVLLSPDASSGCVIQRNVIETSADSIQWVKHNICKVTTGTDGPLTRIANQNFSIQSYLVYYQNNGYIYARNGAAWVSTGVTFDPDKGEEIKCRIDFGTQKWGIFIDDMNTAKVNCMTIQTSLGDIAGFQIAQPKASGDAILDNIIISNFNPDKGA